MNGYQSPRTPSGQSPAYDYAAWSRMSSETPSPMRPSWAHNTPVRPSTRASTHSRHNSYSTQSTFSPRPPRDSPRYNSSGEYATVDVSPQDFVSSSRPPKSHRPKHNRRSSFTYVRSSTPYGESDDEVIEAFGETFVLPAQSRSRGRRYSTNIPDYDGVRYTNYGHYSQESPYYTDRVYSREPSYDMPPRPIAQPRAPTTKPHIRRSSTTMPMPQRPSTTRPGHHGAPRMAKPAAPPVATEEDAKRHRIPAGYSLKNWDPREEPILLLGSVFDANSLGKWIYDWTVYNVGSRGPIAEMAGELWLLLLELTEKTNRAINVGLKVRSKEKRATVNEYLDSSERLLQTLRLLLKNCEAPMLNVDNDAPEKKKKQPALGKNSGIEFVDTLFGRDRELMRTEKFMQKLRTWSIRFETNVVPILENPTA